MNNKKSKKLRGIKRKVRQGFNSLREQLRDIDKNVIVITGFEGLEWLSKCLENEENKDFSWYLQDPNESVRDLLIQTSNEQTI